MKWKLAFSKGSPPKHHSEKKGREWKGGRGQVPLKCWWQEAQCQDSSVNQEGQTWRHRGKVGHSILLLCQSCHRKFYSDSFSSPEAKHSIHSLWRCKGEWGSQVMLTLHRSQTHSSFCLSRAVLLLHNSPFAVFTEHCPFCCLNTASLAVTASIWGGGEERNLNQTSKPTNKPTNNDKANEQKPAAVWLRTGTSSICRSPQGNGWVGLNQEEQSKENGRYHLALLFMTEQGHSTFSRGW